MLGSSEDPTITPAFTFRSDEDASVCHHMISHGRLYYFEDSTHEMRGQCVEMQELTDGLTVMCQEVPAAFTADPSQLFLDFIADL